MFLVGGISLSILTACAQKLKGNENVVTKERPVSGFTHLSIGGVFNAYINQGDKEALKIETDENLQDIIETSNNGNTLVVKWKKGASVEKSTKMNVYITIKDVTDLNIEGIGNVETTSLLNLNNLMLKISGVGNTTLELNCKKLNTNISAVGNVTLKGKVDEVDIVATGTGSLKVFSLMAKKLTAKISLSLIHI